MSAPTAKRQRGPYYKRVQNARRKARDVGAAADLTIEEWKEILDEYDHRCAYCFAPYEHLDHVLPLSLGGGTTKDNVVPACARCNYSKGAHNKQGTGWVPSIASRFWPRLAEEIYA